jgi:hypothetical protein
MLDLRGKIWAAIGPKPNIFGGANQKLGFPNKKASQNLNFVAKIDTKQKQNHPVNYYNYKQGTNCSA